MSSSWSQEKYIDAFRFAAERHGNQKFPGTELSYLLHLSFVTMEVIAALNAEVEFNAKCDFDGNLAVQCACLHDTIEDTNTTREELAARFGEAVAAGVTALSKNERLPKASQMAESLRRIREQPREVQIVKLADRITNLQPPPTPWSREKIAAYADEAQEIYAALADASPSLAARFRENLARYRAAIK